MPERSHPFPSRTRKLSSPGPMVLQGQLCGRVGRCRGFEGLRFARVSALHLFSAHQRPTAAASHASIRPCTGRPGTRTDRPAHAACCIRRSVLPAPSHHRAMCCAMQPWLSGYGCTVKRQGVGLIYIVAPRCYFPVLQLRK